MKVLLIYELIPEETKFYLFGNVNPNSKLYQAMLLANGHYGNLAGEEVGDNEGTEFLSTYLEDQAVLDVRSLPASGPFDVVFHTGFAL